jgi:hypothetical protein
VASARRHPLTKHVAGGRIEILKPNEQGVFGVYLLPDDGDSYAYRSNDPSKVTSFPKSYNVEELYAWAREEWAKRYPA